MEISLRTKSTLTFQSFQVDVNFVWLLVTFWNKIVTAVFTNILIYYPRSMILKCKSVLKDQILCFLFFWRRSSWKVQSGLELTILLPQPLSSGVTTLCFHGWFNYLFNFCFLFHVSKACFSLEASKVLGDVLKLAQNLTIIPNLDEQTSAFLECS